MMTQRRVTRHRKDLSFSLVVATELPDGRRAAVHLEVFDFRRFNGPLGSFANLVAHLQLPNDHPADGWSEAPACSFVNGKCRFDTSGLTGEDIWEKYGDIDRAPEDQPEELWKVLEQFLEVHVRGAQEP